MNIQISRKISSVSARQIFDSRGNPTVEACVVLENGSVGIASSPSGASTGMYEAHEKRDGGKDFGGKGVLGAVESVNEDIAKLLVGMDASLQREVDAKMCSADGSENKSVFGANAILAVSLATSKAAASSFDMPLYRYMGGAYARVLPIPMMNILNGGAHASNNIDIQEFMIMPSGAKCFKDAMKMGCEVYAALKSLLSKDKLSVSVGDEGGFAPNLKSDEEALKYITDAIEKAGYNPEEEISIALDIASSEWQFENKYKLVKQGSVLSAGELMNYYESLIKKYPIISIEDPFSEEDWKSFSLFTEKHPDLQIVGDDLFVTNRQRIIKGIDLKAANAVLIKPNQIGSLSETFDAVLVATENGYNSIISHRSGETPDSTIADIAVATNAGQIKTGAPARGERISKYNRLLRIEEELGIAAVYGGIY